MQHYCEHLSSPNMAVIGVGKSLAAAEKERQKAWLHLSYASYLTYCSVRSTKEVMLVFKYAHQERAVSMCAYIQEYLKK